MPETIQCTFCGNARSRFLFKSQPLWPVPPRHKSLHLHHWNQCLGCGLIFLNPRLNDDELREILRRDAEELESDFFFDSERAWEYVRKRKFLEKHMPGGRLLDMGCEFGFFQNSLGTHWQVAGIETDEAAAAMGKNRLGVDISTGAIKQVNLEAGVYDAITCWDTLDHVADPVSVLSHLHVALRPGGILCLSTADASAAVPRLAGPHWRYLQTPDHRFAFTRAWLRKALAATGFRVVSMETYNRGPDFLFPFIEQCVHESARALTIMQKRLYASKDGPKAPVPCIPMFHDIILVSAIKK